MSRLVDVLDDVASEAERARRKFGHQTDLSDAHWLAVMAEEFGESAMVVSPLPLFAGRLDVDLVQPKPHNGYREPGADSARIRGTWAGYTAEQRQARVDRAAAGRRRQLASLPQ